MNYDIRQLFDIPLKGSTVSLQQYDRIYLFELFGIPINATIVSTWIVILVLFLISFLATRNLSNVILLEANEINVLDIISSDYMVVTEKAIKMIEEVLV